MCRWFAYISPTEPCLLEDVLITPKHGLAQQVHDHYLPHLLPHDHDKDSENDIKARNILFNIDGMGVAWYTSASADFGGACPEDPDQNARVGLRPAMYKTIQPPLNDMNFRSICANTETKVCFAHIRASSGSSIATVNNHPFIFGRHTFMHNGAISDFTSIRRAMCNDMSQAAFENVLGATDSEYDHTTLEWYTDDALTHCPRHMAGLYMTYLTDDGDKFSFQREYTATEMATAMHRMVATVLDLQEKAFGSKKKPNSLNLCATDGSKLVAYRFRDHQTSQPPSLYWSTTAGVSLNRKYVDHPDGPDEPGHEVGIAADKHGHHLIVASEPTTYKPSDWHLIGRNQMLLADLNGHFEITDTPYMKSWDAV